MYKNKAFIKRYTPFAA